MSNRHNDTTYEIVVCDKCDGTGVKDHKKLVDPHKGEYDEWNTICPNCKGSGRLEIKTIVKISPYDNPTVGELLFGKLKD